MIRRYVVVYNNGRGHLSGFAPDLPGCCSIGRSLEELRENLHDEVQLRLRKLVCAGRQIPEPTMALQDVQGCGHAELMAVRLQVA